MVSRILEDLRSEHRTMRQLLDMIQHQIALVAEDRQPNGELLLEIAEYFRSYPELFHHPKEELILRHVINHNPEAAETLTALEDAHDTASRDLNRFSRAVVRLLIDKNGAEDRFLSAALAFVDSERRQLAWEDQQLFGLAEDSLDEDDWSEIETMLTSLGHPETGRSVQARFGRVGAAVGHWRSQVA
jgi:hemerythrin-like domain-containing protein